MCCEVCAWDESCAYAGVCVCVRVNLILGLPTCLYVLGDQLRVAVPECAGCWLYGGAAVSHRVCKYVCLCLGWIGGCVFTKSMELCVCVYVSGSERVLCVYSGCERV